MRRKAHFRRESAIFVLERAAKCKKSPNCTKMKKKIVEISERKQFELWKICAIIVWL